MPFCSIFLRHIHHECLRCPFRSWIVHHFEFLYRRWSTSLSHRSLAWTQCLLLHSNVCYESYIGAHALKRAPHISCGRNGEQGGKSNVLGTAPIWCSTKYNTHSRDISHSTQAGQPVQPRDANSSPDTAEFDDAPEVPDATQVPDNIQENSPDVHIYRKTNTCKFWTDGNCTKAAEECKHAHHLFPVTVHRAVGKGYKAASCKYSEGCWWPRDMCGFSHGDDEVATEKTDNLANGRHWYAVMSYVCKICDRSFAEIGQVVEHCRTVHVSPSPAPPAAPALLKRGLDDGSHPQQTSIVPRKLQVSSIPNWDKLGERRRKAVQETINPRT